jgi:cell division protein FtsW (lipid II flippase)
VPRKTAPDFWLFAVALVLLSTGVVMIYSASAIVAADRFRDPYFFLKRQVFWAALGCGSRCAPTIAGSRSSCCRCSRSPRCSWCSC